MSDNTEFNHMKGQHEPAKTLRDEFAMAALNCLSARRMAQYAYDHGIEAGDHVAAMAYEIADAMLEARK